MKEFRINVADALQIERYEKALEELSNTEQPTGKASEVLIYQCNVVKRFFNTCFGEGAAKERFADSFDYREHYKALEELINNANKDLEAFSKEMAQNISKYSANRAKR